MLLCPGASMRVCVCVCVCVYVYVCVQVLRIVSADKILCFIDILIIISSGSSTLYSPLFLKKCL